MHKAYREVMLVEWWTKDDKSVWWTTRACDLALHKSDLGLHKSNIVLHKSDLASHKSDLALHKSDHI